MVWWSTTFRDHFSKTSYRWPRFLSRKLFCLSAYYYYYYWNITPCYILIYICKKKCKKENQIEDQIFKHWSIGTFKLLRKIWKIEKNSVVNVIVNFNKIYIFQNKVELKDWKDGKIGVNAWMKIERIFKGKKVAKRSSISCTSEISTNRIP